jgi:HAE1 family hydrophobic/amphiphilic exporter-1
MNRLTEFALAKRSVTLLLAGALFVTGLLAWGNLKQELLPDIEFPVITVIAPLPGAGAADVADQVTKPIERVISGVPRLESLQSTSANSIGVVVAQFSFGTDVKETRATIEQNLQNAGLPANVEPTVNALNINASPVIIASIAATSEDGLDDAAAVARDTIVPALLGIEGVASVDLTGGEEQRLTITLDPDKLAENGISLGQVTGVLAANNLTFPSGQITTEGTKIPVSTIGRIESVETVENMVVGVKAPAGAGSFAGAGGPPAGVGAATAGGPAGVAGSGAGAPAAPGSAAASGAPASAAPVAPTPVTIGDIATVTLDGVATTGFARTNGNPSLSLSVSKTSTANTVAVADAVTAELAQLDERYSDAVAITVVSDQSTFIKESRDGLLKEGGLGALFAILTIFLFLFSLRSTLVAAVSIPLSLLAALVVMQLTGISLNIMTLGGLAVAVGRVVDDSIVVLENIYRHRAMGEDRMTASIKGPKEVAGAITAATITTVGVFLPLGFVGGIVSQFFLPFALTVTFALLASLVVALTVVPVLAYLFLRNVKHNIDEDGEPKNSLWIRAYTPTITFSLRNRWTKLGILGATLGLFVVTTALAPLIPTAFLNAGSEKILQVTVAPPAGTASEAVLARTMEAEEILIGLEQVETVQSSIAGEGASGSQTLAAAQSGRPANSARITVVLEPSVDLNEESRNLSSALETVKADGYNVEVSQATGFSSNGLRLIVAGDSAAEVRTANDAVLAALEDDARLLNLGSDLSTGTPEIQVTPDPNKAIMVGLTAAQVAGEVRNALVGTTATTVVLGEDEDAVGLYVRLDPAAVASVDDLKALPVGTVAKMPLGELAAVEEVTAQGTITRIDESPAAAITAEIADTNTGAVSRDIQAEIDALVADGSIPDGVNVTLAGVSQQQSEAFGGLFFSMGIAILVVYVAMVLTFNSLITPFIILFSLPLATIGALPALLVTGRPLGISALIGFLMLIGIVVTNAIVLLDLVEKLRAKGMATDAALIEGGRTRVRPILMTAIATILALIPLAAGFNQGSIIAAELGTVVIGGLFSSTFLTLIVVPVIYSLVDGVRAFRRVRRPVELAAAAGAPTAPPAPAAGA